MANLQVVLVNDDVLDDELQDCLLLGERGVVQPAAHAFAERGQVEQEFLGLSALVTQVALLFELALQPTALTVELPSPLGQLLQAVNRHPMLGSPWSAPLAVDRSGDLN